MSHKNYRGYQPLKWAGLEQSKLCKVTKREKNKNIAVKPVSLKIKLISQTALSVQVIYVYLERIFKTKAKVIKV